MMKVISTIALLLLVMSCKSNKPIEENQPQKQPNVLFISIDDLNDWTGSLGGNKQVITPNLDKLADQSTQFTNAHASMAVCVASRNSVLSGLHPSTTGWYALVEDHDAMVASYENIMGDKQMLPALFKSNGYATYSAGKIFHKGATDYPFLMDALWDDVLPDYKEKLRPIDYERGEGYGGYKFYPFPKEGSQLKRFYGDKLKDNHSLCGGPLDEEDMPEGKMYDEFIADYAIDRLKEDHTKPFFLSVGFVRPHVPYTAPRKYFDMYDRNKVKIPVVPSDEMNDIPLIGKAIAYNYGVSNMGDYQAVTGMGDDYWRHLVHSYLACVTFVDDQVGRVIKALEDSKYADNTIIVLWSDHGQSLGEKMNFRKMSLWEGSTKVPLYILTPETKMNGKACSKPVSLLDLYPTLVDLCNLPKQEHLEGRSLKKLIENPEIDWPYPVVTSWRYKNYAIRSQDFRYIQYRDGTEELYDHRNDPGEHTNLASNGMYSTVIEDHKKWIPQNAALPVGKLTWDGDEIDRRIDEWKKNDSMPSWLGL